MELLWMKLLKVAVNLKKMFDKNISELRVFLKNNIINSQKFFHHEKERNEIYDLLKKTIIHGESNSALLIGPSGSGKTTLINNVLKELEGDKHFESDAVLIKLNGLVHTSDRLALSSIHYQMKLETVMDGKVFGSFAENLSFLLECLKSGTKTTAKSVVFILDQFDLFCGHHNQTLIYNLFDISQSPQTPVCVIGITCRLDVIELLEKRVKSRFSHRQIFLFHGKDEDSNLSQTEHALKKIEHYLTIPKEIVIPTSFKKQWNSKIKGLLENKSFKSLIEKLINIDNSENTLKRLLLMAVCRLNNEKTELTVGIIEEQMKIMQQDDTVAMLQDLSVLELCLIIAMKHHMEIYDQNIMNFEMVYTRFLKFANTSANVQITSRDIVMKAFERIENLELISMLHSSNVQKEFQLFKLLFLPQQVTEAINNTPRLPTEVVHWSTTSF